MDNQFNPLHIDVLGQLDSEKYVEEIQELARQIKKDDQSRSSWVDDVRKIRKLIKGKDKRKRKPWRHASETSIPLIKKMIRRWKPSLYALFAGADPVCAFHATTAQGLDQSPKAELFFDWLVKVYMDDTDTSIQYLVDDIGADGSGNIGVSWDYRTELRSRVLSVDNIFPEGVPKEEEIIIKTLREQYEIVIMSPTVEQELKIAAQKIMEGNSFVRITYRQIVANKPKITAFNSEYIIVPPHCLETHNAEYVAILNPMSENDMLQYARDGMFNADAVMAFLSDKEKKKSDATTETGTYSDNQQLVDAGVTADDTRIPVYQVYCKIDLDGDGIKERAVIWMSIDEGIPHIFAMYPFALSIPHWPIFRFDYEKSARGPYRSMGIGQLLEELQKQLNKQYRAKSDAIDIQLAPVYQKRITGGLRSRNIKWGPGKIIDVQEIGDLAPVEKSPFNLHEYINSESQIEAHAESLLGSLVNDLQATGRKLERRTATEVNKVGQSSEALASMDAASFQNTMRLVWQTVWQLWLDLGPREIYHTVTGAKTPVLFKKGDFNKNYQLMPTGTPGNTDRQKQLGYTMELLQILLQDPSGSGNIPYLIRRVAQLIDARIADAALIPQATQAALQSLEQAAALINAGELPPDLQGVMSDGASKIEESQ
jgi:hypothetical protein